jgi:hypothetical protein
MNITITPLTILFFIFALCEISVLIQYKNGPFNIFEKIRNYFNVYLVEVPIEVTVENSNTKLQLYTSKDNFFTNLLMCHWCHILEFAIVLIILYLLIPTVITYLILILAIAFISSIIISIIERFELI